MEGLMDYNLRDMLTLVGGIDHCVSEFIRVIDQGYPAEVFRRFCLELHNYVCTAAGAPVHIQLLGSNPEAMAANAAKAAALDAPANDINFGCPAKTVNKSKGLAVLLQYTDQLHDIAKAVRQAVPAHIPVSAKIRLGFLDKELAIDNSVALAEADIQWLCVHARTKTEGYKPPAYWDYIARIKDKVDIPVLSNGEIWTAENAEQCVKESGSDILMIGRGLVSMPDLGLQIQHHYGLREHQDLNWQQQLDLFLSLVPKLDHLLDKQITDRLKQWLFYFTRHFPEITELFDAVKRERNLVEFLQVIHQFKQERKVA